MMCVNLARVLAEAPIKRALRYSGEGRIRISSIVRRWQRHAMWGPKNAVLMRELSVKIPPTVFHVC